MLIIVLFFSWKPKLEKKFIFILPLICNHVYRSPTRQIPKYISSCNVFPPRPDPRPPGYSGGHSHRVWGVWSSPHQQDNLLRGQCFWSEPSRKRHCSLWEKGSGVCGQDEGRGPLYGEYQVGYEGSSQVLVIPGTACNVTLTENYCSLTRRYRESSGPTFRALLRTSLLSRPHQFPVRDSSLSVGSSARTRDAISLPRTSSVVCCWRLTIIFKDLHKINFFQNTLYSSFHWQH